ncbi:uncharacterized protein [Nicotiana sylvestris]|uniref:uncharacterized protein n=1 Tax=Nicotiana sylvestris TaxID=4096 RepID=UPI00388C7106
MDPLNYIFQKPMPTRKLAKWQILLSKFNIVYVTQKAVKEQALADHLAKNPVGGEYKPLKTYFPNKEVSSYERTLLKLTTFGVCSSMELQTSKEWALERFWFPCTNNMAEYEPCIMGLNLAIDMNIQELLVINDSDLLVHQVQGEWATKNTKILPYLYHVQELMKRFTKIEFKHVPRIQNEFADALATLPSIIQYPDKNFINPVQVRIHNQPAYCAHVDEEMDGKPWFHNIKEYLARGEYPE